MSSRLRRQATVAALVVGAVGAAVGGIPAARGQADGADALPAADAGGAFGFAVIGTATNVGDRGTTILLRAVADVPSTFVVHYERSEASAASCTDAAIDHRRDLIDASPRPVVPVVAAAQWADCGSASGNPSADPANRLERVDDVLFGGEESLGRTRLRWLRQSALPRYRRYRENVRWQAGGVLFATLNVPANNNDFHAGAGRNGEFDERVAANRAWLDRTFRVASERRLRGVVLFIEAAPRFDAPLRPPDTRVRERDGYYELKLALREHVAAYAGQVLLVQSQRLRPTNGALVDHPLRDPAGHPLERFARVALPAEAGESRWLRITVDPARPRLFDATVERVFDDPSGELYGAMGVRSAGDRR